MMNGWPTDNCACRHSYLRPCDGLVSFFMGLLIIQIEVVRRVRESLVLDFEINLKFKCTCRRRYYCCMASRWCKGNSNPFVVSLVVVVRVSRHVPNSLSSAANWPASQGWVVRALAVIVDDGPEWIPPYCIFLKDPNWIFISCLFRPLCLLMRKLSELLASSGRRPRLPTNPSPSKRPPRSSTATRPPTGETFSYCITFFLLQFEFRLQKKKIFHFFFCSDDAISVDSSPSGSMAAQLLDSGELFLQLYR